MGCRLSSTSFLVYGDYQLTDRVKNTSVSLGNYFESFVENTISGGRFKNTSEVIRAGLRLLEDEENKRIALKNAIQVGIESGISEAFNPIEHLNSLKALKRNE